MDFTICGVSEAADPHAIGPAVGRVAVGIVVETDQSMGAAIADEAAAKALSEGVGGLAVVVFGWALDDKPAALPVCQLPAIRPADAAVPAFPVGHAGRWSAFHI